MSFNRAGTIRTNPSSKIKSATAKTRETKSAKILPPAATVRKHVIPRPNLLHSYLDHRQVNQYMEYVANRYSNFVKVYTLGYSHERREIRGIEIDYMNAGNTDLPPQLRMQSAPTITAAAEATAAGAAEGTPLPNTPRLIEGERGRNIVFIEAGTHAREWITVSTALNCIYQVTERYTRNVELLRKLRFFIVPLVNPDGYEYSRIKNRKWRKNRRPHKNSKFVGTDCNRNYDIYWDAGPCKLYRNTYKGEKPFSEPETRAMRNMLDKVKPNLLFFLTLHSYGQSIMFPWGYSREPTLYHRELLSLSNAGRNAIKSYSGREYRTGSIASLTKRTIAGSVVDYVYGVVKAPMALVMELPSQSLGFQPPVEMISQIGHESWFGIREMCKHAFDLRSQIKRENEKLILPLPPQPQPQIQEHRISGGDQQQQTQLKLELDENNNKKIPLSMDAPATGVRKIPTDATIGATKPKATTKRTIAATTTLPNKFKRRNKNPKNLTLDSNERGGVSRGFSAAGSSKRRTANTVLTKRAATAPAKILTTTSKNGGGDAPVPTKKPTVAPTTKLQQ